MGAWVLLLLDLGIRESRPPAKQRETTIADTHCQFGLGEKRVLEKSLSDMPKQASAIDIHRNSTE